MNLHPSFILVAAVAASMLTACQDHRATERQQNPQGLIPDMQVSIAPEGYGCVSLLDFDQAHEARLAGQNMRWAEIITRVPACFRATVLAPGATFTVMEVQGLMMKVAQTNVDQYKADPRFYKSEYWVATRWGVPVR